MPLRKGTLLNPTELMDTHTASSYVVNKAGDYVQCEKPVRMQHDMCEAHVENNGATVTYSWPNPT